MDEVGIRVCPILGTWRRWWHQSGVVWRNGRRCAWRRPFWARVTGRRWWAPSGTGGWATWCPRSSGVTTARLAELGSEAEGVRRRSRKNRGGGMVALLWRRPRCLLFSHFFIFLFFFPLFCLLDFKILLAGAITSQRWRKVGDETKVAADVSKCKVLKRILGKG